MNDNFSVRPTTYNGDSEIKSSDELTPPYPTSIVTNENFCLNLENTGCSEMKDIQNLAQTLLIFDLRFFQKPFK